jgi:hypothetical protein
MLLLQFVVIKSTITKNRALKITINIPDKFNGTIYKPPVLYRVIRQLFDNLNTLLYYNGNSSTIKYNPILERAYHSGVPNFMNTSNVNSLPIPVLSLPGSASVGAGTSAGTSAGAGASAGTSAGTSVSVGASNANNKTNKTNTNKTNKLKNRVNLFFGTMKPHRRRLWNTNTN